MFTGIVEAFADVTRIEKEGTNTHFWLRSSIGPELKIDQSLAHDGICLTVVELDENDYRVTAIKETLDRTTAGKWQVGDKVNLERCLKADGRFDGHIVQGHVDCLGTVDSIEDIDGSFNLCISHPSSANYVTVEKGSICINGVSLTVVESKEKTFSVSIIPYTWEHTNFNKLQQGSRVNLEFDILGKYFAKMFRK